MLINWIKRKHRGSKRLLRILLYENSLSWLFIILKRDLPKISKTSSV